MDRAYSLLEVRSVKENERVIEGIASTPTPDRMGDIVEPMGAKFALPMPLLWQHQHDKPVGHVEFAKPTKAGIPFKARLAKIDEPGALKDRVDEAWQSVKSNLVRAVSIGFRALEYNRMDDGGLRFLSWEWMELSLVTIPANNEAVITAVKNLDRQHLPAIGREVSVVPPPVVSGTNTKAALRGPVKLIPRKSK
jgi:HK97 family phage prohead protease